MGGEQAPRRTGAACLPLLWSLLAGPGGLALGWADAGHLKPPGRAVLGSLFLSRLGESQGFPLATSPPWPCWGWMCGVSGRAAAWSSGQMAAGEGAGVGSPGHWWTGGAGGGRLAWGRGTHPRVLFIASPSPRQPRGGPSREGLSAFSSSGHVKKAKNKPARGAGQLG